MAHGLEKEATPRASASTKHGSHKRGGTGAAADVLLEQLEVTGFDNASSRRLIRTFVQGQQATYKRQLEAIYMDKQANALQAFPPTACPPAFPPAPTPPPPTHNAHSTAALPIPSPSCAPQVVRRCYNRPWAVNMRTDQQHQAGGKRAPSHRQAPIHVQAQAQGRGQSQGRKQAGGTAPTPASGANGTVPPPYRKHSDSAMRHAERVRLARMNIALTKLEPAEVAMSMAEQCAPPTHRTPVPPSPPSHLHLLPFPPSFLSTRHTHKVGHIFTPTPS